MFAWCICFQGGHTQWFLSGRFIFKFTVQTHFSEICGLFVHIKSPNLGILFWIIIFHKTPDLLENLIGNTQVHYYYKFFIVPILSKI